MKVGFEGVYISRTCFPDVIPATLGCDFRFNYISSRYFFFFILDTFTTLQEAIYRAKWNVKKTGNSREPLEWRLPKAPPPARPDYTRVFPPVRHHPLVHYQNRPLDRNVSGGHVMVKYCYISYKK